jgi:hypothetical protein
MRRAFRALARHVDVERVMRTMLLAVPALIVAGATAAQDADRRNPIDPQAKAPRTEYRSAFDGYRPFTEQDLRDWRKANQEVREAGGHAGHKPGQGSGQQTSKPQPGSPDASGHQGHGAHK